MRKARFFVSILTTLLFCSGLFAVEISEAKQSFIDAAKSYLGTPYAYGGTSESGIDCSGLIYMAAKKSKSVTLPRTVSSLYSFATQIESSQKEPGDLVFFSSESKASHVGIYLGNNKFIHSASEGSKTGVIISKLSESYWSRHFLSYGRVIASKSAVASSPSKSTTKSSVSKSSSTASLDLSDLKLFENLMAGLFVDWTILEPNKHKISLKGGTIMAGTKFTDWIVRPGLLAKFTYQAPDYFQVPVCISLDFGKYVQIYGGITLGTDYICKVSPYVNGLENLQVPLFPGHAGISVKTPGLQIGTFKYSLMQDISYTYFKNNDGSKLSLKDSVAAGLNFSTGICITGY